MRHFQNLEVD